MKAKEKEWLDLLLENIIFEDKDIIALNKPVGLAVQGGNKVSHSVDKLLNLRGDGVSYRLTHRLDRDTSGVLLVAKNEKWKQIVGCPV